MASSQLFSIFLLANLLLVCIAFEAPSVNTTTTSTATVDSDSGSGSGDQTTELKDLTTPVFTTTRESGSGDNSFMHKIADGDPGAVIGLLAIIIAGIAALVVCTIRSGRDRHRLLKETLAMTNQHKPVAAKPVAEKSGEDTAPGVESIV
eukprot:m.64149 g.64149  ORF g.64149 m.64149 type:complete len:149 (+) comp11626_c0_seq1:245-691(+)